MLTKTINALFFGTRYVVWGLAILGIVGSAILALVNFSMGISSAFICIGALFLSISITFALFPEPLVKGSLLGKRFHIAAVAGFLALAMAGIIYFTNSGFPELNLIFA